MKTIIGIDAGGTKTTGMVMDQKEQVLFEFTGDHGNPVVSYEQALENISEVIQNCLYHTADQQTPIVIGMAGAGAGKVVRQLKEQLHARFSSPIFLIGDATLAYYHLLKEKDGVMAIAGTGSMIYGRKGQREETVGGWGHLLGDEGSAYHLAIQAIKKITSELDTCLPPSSLSLAIQTTHGLRTSTEIKSFIYQSSKGEIAEIAVTVAHQAMHGDADAILLLQKAGRELGEQTITLLRKLDCMDINVGFKGSLLEKNPFVREAFQCKVKDSYPTASFLSSSSSPCLGAIAFYQAYEKGLIAVE